MPLLENGHLITDTWHYAVDGEALGAGPVIVPLSRLSEGLGRITGALGVVLPVDQNVSALRDSLPKISLVVIGFPIFRDGRPFSQARALREHLHFTGEIRASGHILPDQYEFLIRCGVTTVEVAEETDLSAWERALHQFRVAMQPSVMNEKPTGFGLRRFLPA
ncbi:DUF934 domain-containing protein [Acetobacter oeni]|uniref:Oxidoreductase n=1 Tax=Acetobacter oeni TaxID=304077 RepID=A0A511XL38_9PROT|nr:DUF934 domain-containing protein [Acetobacter oeni]MBB3883953.1 uncharacterized protein (DUF934 family) [Acetobacter oeni]NHO19957.1 DUF934 domain-containing protein [Acetobacter oeni]GBR05764.1 hypothetical protein AA21952_1821 [Acetobacter oeni LMG 21952]GEN63663.1 oxidoreductase [Acetobacter oeni]